MRVHRLVISVSVALLSAIPTTLTAQAATDYPTKTVRLVVPYPPGAVTNIVGRLLADKLTLVWGPRVLVENRPGGDGTIGTNVVAKSAPDGYTFGLVIASQAITPLLYKDMPYDIQRDLIPITLIAEYPFVLLVHPQFAARNVSELIRLAKANPGKLTIASSGNGSGPHIAIEMFKLSAGVNITHVPYKGGGQALIDVAGGSVDAFHSSLLSAKPLLDAGKLKVLAVTSPKRFESMPDVEAIAEVLPGFSITNWLGFVAPAGTPPEIVENISSNVVRVLREPDVREHLKRNGLVPRGTTPAEFGVFFRAETEKYRKVISAGKITLEN